MLHTFHAFHSHASLIYPIFNSVVLLSPRDATLLRFIRNSKKSIYSAETFSSCSFIPCGNFVHAAVYVSMIFDITMVVWKKIFIFDIFLYFSFFLNKNLYDLLYLTFHKHSG